MYELYSLIKLIHISTVSFTGFYFIIRGLSQFNHYQWYRKRWARRISQYNDTVLLLSGISMAVIIEQYPFVNSWLTAKLFLLLVYILLGMLSFYWLHNKKQKMITWSFALLVYGYIIGVAINKNPAWIVTVLS
ncbi:MAG TPA: regulator SirB [Gammaproteobacteria bacterium]|nr:regulator SirB [Gammaproteobacteria bacterium]